MDLEIELNDDEFEILRDMVYEKTGMYFKENKKYLIKSRLMGRLKELKLNSYKDYYYRVKYDSKESVEMINCLTTNETSFFRTMPHITELQQKILPEFAKKGAMVRIWSAACSTGEEPYTIAIIIKELEKKGIRIPVEIIGTDIDEQVLHKAREGLYTMNSFRGVENGYIQNYFKKQGQLYAINPEIKNMVKFSKLNLIDSLKMTTMKNFDVVLCRNVLIYFSQESRKKVIEHLYLSLKKDGYFFLGHSETLHGVFDGFQVVHVPGAVLYKKG